MRGRLSRQVAAARVEAVSATEQSGAEDQGGSNSVVESQPSKLLVAGSIPVSRSKIYPGDFVPPDPLAPSLAGGPSPRSAPAGAAWAAHGVGDGEGC